MEAWFKAARKVCPEIPNPEKTDWQIIQQEATKDSIFIIYDLANTVGDRCKVTVNRKIPLIG